LPLKGSGAFLLLQKKTVARKILFLCLLKIYLQQIFTHHLAAEDLPKINQFDHECR
jgi:hypothetical protein